MTVYVVGHAPRTGPVKIGRSADVEHRLRCLRRGEACSLAVMQRFSQSRPPSDLKLLHSMSGGLDLERQLHRRLRKFRIEGEWFSLGKSPEVVVAAVEAARLMSTEALELPLQTAAPAAEADIRADERRILADLIEERFRLAPNADQREALRGILEVYRPRSWRSGR